MGPVGLSYSVKYISWSRKRSRFFVIKWKLDLGRFAEILRPIRRLLYWQMPYYLRALSKTLRTTIELENEMRMQIYELVN